MNIIARRVLIVDDDHDTTDGFSMILEAEGHEVRGAYDGPTAIEIAKDFRPEFVFLDLGIPEWDGYAIARALRDCRAGKKCVWLLLLDGAGDTDKQHTTEAGFDAHLVKPAAPEKILDLLRY